MQKTDWQFSPNQFYEDFFLQATEFRAQKNAPCCCLAVDVQHFKLFTQVVGQNAGRELLEAFATYFSEMDGVFAYFGQDDFVLFLEHNDEKIKEIHETLKEIVSRYSLPAMFRPAIGVYPLEEGEEVGITMYDKAVTAVERAKKLKTEPIFYHDVVAYEKSCEEYRIIDEVKRAGNRGEITFYLQPQCRISSGKIVGAEALARWVKPDGSVVPPYRFIPALEKNGFISDFDRYIWTKVCEWLRSLLDRGVQPVPVSINVSQMDLKTLDVVKELVNLTTQYEIPTSLLKVEITESAYAGETDLVRTVVKDLRQNGFVTMMDDFGSGYSSLNMLESVNVDVIKLDMAFIRGENLSTRKGVTILESIVNMSKMMGIPIVVEGVETEEQLTFLKGLGCRYAQGYYFFKPMPIRELEILIEDGGVDYSGFVSKANEQFHVREFLDEATFTDSLLNNVLGAVAFYSLEGKDLNITRFNGQFYDAISDDKMQKRQGAIQNYIVKDDWPILYKTLKMAREQVGNGATCEIRFYKSDDSVFWFRMHFFYLRNEGDKSIYFGQVEDVTEVRQQSLQFFEVLRKQSEICLLIDLDRERVQYVNLASSLDQIGLPSLDLEDSISRTVEARIENAADKKAFIEFFSPERLISAYKKAIYHETLTIGFRLRNFSEPVEFSTYYIRHSKDQGLFVYAFAKRIG